MKKELKKRIAKELIYLYIGACILVLIWAGLLLWNVYYSHEKNTVTSLIVPKETIIDSLKDDIMPNDKTNIKFDFSDIVDEKQQFDFSDIVEEPIKKKLDGEEGLEKKIITTKTEEEEQQKQEELKNKINQIQTEIEKLYSKKWKYDNKVLERYEIIDFLKYSGLLLLVLLYPVRIFYILLKWSIKTLKE